MKKISLLPLLSFIIIFPFTINAQNKYTPLLNSYMQAQFDIDHFSGSVLIEKKGQTIYSSSFGDADKEWHIKNTAQAKYRIGSITKQFTAACILQLEERGKLSLNDKLSKYIPDYPRGDKVTLHMLMNQTSGIKDYTEIPDSGAHSDVLPLAPIEIINSFKRAPYNFDPGTQWAYSNSNYFLLGYIIEKVSGEKYSDYLQKNIIQKAGMKNTGVDRPDSVLQFRAKGYEDAGPYYVNAPYFAIEGPFSAGAMYSTVNDLDVWIKALMNNKILLPASVKKMTTPYMGQYGYGLWIDSLSNHKRVWHNGGIPGFASFVANFPADDLRIVILSNNESNTPAIANALASILFDIKVINPYVHRKAAINSAVLDNYIGQYVTKNIITLIKKDGKLYRKGNGTEDLELIPESATKFFYSDGSDRQIEFEVDKSGKVSKSYIIVGGLKMEMKKVITDVY